MIQFLFLHSLLYSVRIILFLYFFDRPFLDLATSISFISLFALVASLYAMLSCFQLLSLLKDLFRRFTVEWRSVIMYFNPLGNLFFSYLQISLISPSFSSDCFFHFSSSWCKIGISMLTLFINRFGESLHLQMILPLVLKWK